ncbi:MAG: hypothetical protein V7711_03240 [Pseudomonadales bacterium]
MKQGLVTNLSSKWNIDAGKGVLFTTSCRYWLSDEKSELLGITAYIEGVQDEAELAVIKQFQLKDLSRRINKIAA